MTNKFRRPGTPSPIRSAEDRDLEALKRRREERADESVDVDVSEEGDVTQPTDLIIAELEQSPALRELWDRVSRIKQEDRRVLRQLGSKTLEIHQNVDPELAKRVEAIEKHLASVDTTMKIAKWILGFVIAATLGSIVVVATKIFSWGYGSGEIENRLKYIEKDLERLNQRFWRQSSPLQPPDTKQVTP